MSQDGDIYAADQLSREDALAGPEDDVADELDRGYSPPEKPSGALRYGTTGVGEIAGETLEERLEQEVPEEDPYEAAAAEDVTDLDVGEVGDERAGRLVDPDSDAGLGSGQGMVGDDAGIDGAAAGAEEAAVHVVLEDDETI